MQRKSVECRGKSRILREVYLEELREHGIDIRFIHRVIYEKGVQGGALNRTFQLQYAIQSKREAICTTHLELFMKKCLQLGLSLGFLQGELRSFFEIGCQMAQAECKMIYMRKEMKENKKKRRV